MCHPSDLIRMHTNKKKKSIMAVKLELPAVPPFKVTGNETCLGQQWEDWIITYYADASGVTNAAQKRAMLLHLAAVKFRIFFIR